MAQNTLGKHFSITSFGESHGPGIGVVIDGCPAGLELHLSAIQAFLDRRKPGQNTLSTDRKEEDILEVLSGLYENKTTGSPVTLWIANKDAKPKDYADLKDVYRPNHADYTYDAKYGFRDHRGGGRSSARVTAGWVAAGAVAEQFLQAKSAISIVAFVSRVHNESMQNRLAPYTRKQVDESQVRCPEPEAAMRMQNVIALAKAEGDSLGGSITCVIKNCPAGLGEPVFGKLDAVLAHAMLNINAVKAIEFGDGIESTFKKGSENNDAFTNNAGKITTITNHSGGIQGGISNGHDIVFTVYFKPTASIAKPQQTVNRDGNIVDLEIQGRHDPCVLPRAVPIVEAMAAIVIADLWLENQLAAIGK